MSSLLAFFVLICVLVFVHEYGHFWAARRCGVKVIRFSIGFGKVLWKKCDKQGTEWAFSLIPLGGYVQMANQQDNPTASPAETYNNKSVWARMFIILAGPLANLLFAILAYWAVFMAGVPTLKTVVGSVLPQTIAANAKLTTDFEIQRVAGQNVQDWEEVTLALLAQIGKSQVVLEGKQIDEDRPLRFTLDLSDWQVNGNKQNPLTALGIRPQSPQVEPVIRQVSENSVASRAGLQAGDKMISVNGEPFDWGSLVAQIQTGKPLTLLIEQHQQRRSVELIPEKSDKEGRYLIGISPQYKPLAEKYRTELKYDMLTAFQKSLEKVAVLIKTIIQFIGNLITGELSLSNMGGPISMAKGAGATAEIGVVYFLSFMALISVNLGVMNLFPLLPLDGGQLILLSIEAVRSKPISEKWQIAFQKVGMLFVLGLMGFALANDIIQF